ncbi:MAG: TIGR00730 family Rossman fold protein [Chthoniobacteraceae bacterium]
MPPDFTATSIGHSYLPSIGDAEIDRQISELLEKSGVDTNTLLIQELIVTALKIGRENYSVADLKLFNRALKEMRSAARMFAPYTGRKKVVVFGSARTKATEPAAIAAEEFTARMREHGYMTITGGGDGIMGAAQKGAGRDFGFGLNIKLPFEQRANETIHGDRKLVNFNYFFTRKLNFVKESHAITLFPGGFGTMDEGFEVLTLMQTGKSRIIPYVLVDTPGSTFWQTWLDFLKDQLLKSGLVSETDFHLFKLTDSVDEAVQEILQFYKNFRSYRWVNKKMVIRLEKAITDHALQDLNTRFSDLLQVGLIEQGSALPEEMNEPELARLPRLILTPHQRDYGKIRLFLDAINQAPVVE